MSLHLTSLKKKNQHPLHPVSLSAGSQCVYFGFVFLCFVFDSIEKFCAEGIPLLGILIQSRHLRTVVHVLDKILPLFYSCQYYLLKNEQ